MALLFNTLSRFVIAFLQRSKCLLIPWLQSPSHLQWFWRSRKSATVSTFSPPSCHEVMGMDAIILVFWMLSFKPAFCTVLFHFHQEALLPAILIPACASSSLAFRMMYSAYKLNKQDDNIQPWHTPFSILNQSIVPCPVLTVASWPAYRCLRRQVRWSGIPISFRLFHSLLWST